MYLSSHMHPKSHNSSMGEKDKSKKGGEKKADAGGKKDDGPVTAVFKIDLHCEGCAKKIKRSIRHFEGVERVKADCESNKLTVTGKVDPTRLKERLVYKTKLKVEIFSPQPKKDAPAADKKTDGKKPEEKKTDDKKPKQEPQDSTVVMKIRLHCDGCVKKIKKILKKTDGVNKVTMDVQKDLVTIVGKMNMKELIPSLKEKLKLNVEIIPPKKDDKKESGGEKKKDGESKATTSGGDGSKGGDSKVETKKMDHFGYSFETHTTPAYNHNYYNQDYGLPVHNYTYANHDYGNHHYVQNGYPVEYFQAPLQYSQPPYYGNVHNHQMFSDENANGCFIM